MPWLPFTLPPRWPFCFWLVLVLDHFSRAVVAHQLFRKEPTAADVCGLLNEARRRAGASPRYTITDQGVQFREEYRDWCRRNGVGARFGAVGEHGSVALIERFFRSLKEEMLRRLAFVPLSMPRMDAEISSYVGWYLTHRPHQGLGGRTPAEVLDGVEPARDLTRLETRPRYPLPRGSPERRPRRVAAVALDVERFEGRDHLPVVSLRDAA